MTVTRRRFVLSSASPLRALVEAGILALNLVLALAVIAPDLQNYVITNGALFISGVSALWLALRLRWPPVRFWHHLVELIPITLVYGLWMSIGIPQFVSLIGLGGALARSNFGFLGIMLVLGGSSAIFAGLRIALRLWFFWDHLRRTRLIWSLTHAHLTVVVVIVALVAAVFSLVMIAVNSPQITAPIGSLPWVITRVLITLFLFLFIFVIAAFFSLAVLLPPSALVSFWIARRTIDRLSRLSQVTGALRSGDYRARVPVSGEDEVAQVQSDLNAMADEMERTLTALQAERDRVNALLIARRELVANVSHELRTPVATIRGYIESSLASWDEQASPELRHDLQVIDGEVTRLQNLIDDLFTLARADVRQLALDCQPTDLAPIIQQSVEVQAPLAWQTGKVEVVAQVSGELMASIDSARFQQVLANLIRNGVKHTPPGGIVAVRAATESQSVVVQVCDTGEGIAAEDLPHIWERFYRGKSGASADSGSAGLGLALVQELVEAMGGTVAVESSPGQGSMFIVNLPRA